MGHCVSEGDAWHVPTRRLFPFPFKSLSFILVFMLPSGSLYVTGRANSTGSRGLDICLRPLLIGIQESNYEPVFLVHGWVWSPVCISESEDLFWVFLERDLTFYLLNGGAQSEVQNNISLSTLKTPLRKAGDGRGKKVGWRGSHRVPESICRKDSPTSGLSYFINR